MDQDLPKTLHVIGLEWKQQARELADWAMLRLVNRLDVWGQYTSMRQRQRGHKALTLPQKAKRGQDMVSLDKLARHFGSLRRDHLIGLHASHSDETCKWLAIDIDLHDPEADDAEDAARRNFAAATGWWEKLQQHGYDPLLLDSNGAGGFHIWILFDQPAPMADVHAFGQTIIADWETRNLDVKPETFPKSGQLGGDKMGAWLRLPGLHHSRDHFTRVWSGDPWLDEPWSEGASAIDSLLEAATGPPPPASNPEDSKRTKKAAKAGPSRRRRPSSGKPAVCVDLDGVLAHYDQWQGPFHFGEPIAGSAQFLQNLSAAAEVIIFTARLHDTGDGENLDEIEHAVREWLERHGLAFSSIYRGTGKPFARAYVDDRAVSCRPQAIGPHAAFTQAEADVRELLK